MSSADTKDDSMSFLPRGEAVTRFLILFGDAKRRFLVLGIARTILVFYKKTEYLSVALHLLHQSMKRLVAVFAAFSGMFQIIFEEYFDATSNRNGYDTTGNTK